MPILSDGDLEFFRENGYVVARNAISAQQAELTASEVWEFSGMNPEDPESWYGDSWRDGGYKEGKIMVEMYHGQHQWENRTAPGVHEAFSQIWGTRRLWCSHDRASINPPCTDPEILNDPSREARGVHWDNGQLRLAESGPDVGPLGFGVQGVLYLVDTPAENGAFVCVPGFHRVVDRWLAALPKGAAPAQQDYLTMRGPNGQGLTRVGANAGDLVIWTTTLPHYAAVNIGTAPRVAQYITMSPAPQAQDDATRAGRIKFWSDRQAGNGNANKEAGEATRLQPVAQLGPTARQIAGIDPWPETEGNGEAFSGMTAEWTPEVAARL